MNSSLNNNKLSLKKGDVLFREGEFSEYLYIVDEGEICTFLVSESRAILLNLYKTKDLLGENSVHKERLSYSENAVAMCDTKVVKIKTSDIQKYLAESDVWVNDILQELSHKIHKTQKSIRDHKVSNTQIFKGGFNLELEKFLIKCL